VSAELPEPPRKLQAKLPVHDAATRRRQMGNEVDPLWARKSLFEGKRTGDLYGRTANVPNTLC
jgi:hypothetical protein